MCITSMMHFLTIIFHGGVGRLYSIWLIVWLPIAIIVWLPVAVRSQAPVPLTVFRSNSKFNKKKIEVLWFEICSADHSDIFPTSRQCYCRDVCKISLRSAEYVMSKSIAKFHWIPKSVEIPLVGRTPGHLASWYWSRNVPVTAPEGLVSLFIRAAQCIRTYIYSCIYIYTYTNNAWK